MIMPKTIKIVIVSFSLNFNDKAVDGIVDENINFNITPPMGGIAFPVPPLNPLLK